MEPVFFSVVVDQSDIDNGHAVQAEHCPIALAMASLGMNRPVVSQLDMVWSDDEGQDWQCATPSDVALWITDFDTGWPVGPLDFVILGAERLTPGQAG